MSYGVSPDHSEGLIAVEAEIDWGKIDQEGPWTTFW